MCRMENIVGSFVVLMRYATSSTMKGGHPTCDLGFCDLISDKDGVLKPDVCASLDELEES